MRLAVWAPLILLLSFSQAYANHPDFDDLSKLLQKAYEKNDFASAGKILKIFQDHFPVSAEMSDIELEYARRCPVNYEAIGQYQNYTDRYRNFPDAPKALLELAQLYQISGNATFARREAKRLIERYPKSPLMPEARMLMARFHAISGRWAAAANEYAMIIQSHDKHPCVARARFGLAEAKYEMGKFGDAKTILKGLLDQPEAGTDAAHIFLLLARIESQGDNDARAVRYYRIVSNKLPDNFFKATAKNSLNALGVDNQEFLSADSDIKPPPEGPTSEYAVLLGLFGNDKAAKEAEVFFRAGFSTKMESVPEGKTKVLIGSFPTEIQARFFAEELEKKYGRKMEVIRVDPN